MRILRSAVSVTALLALAACGGDRTADDTADNMPDVSADPAVAPAPMAPALRVTDLELGRAMQGDTAVVDETDDFNANDTIHAVVRHEGAASGVNITARWTFEDGQVVDERTETVSPDGTGPAYTHFQIANPSGWPAGNYRLTILINGEEVESEEFSVDG